MNDLSTYATHYATTLRTLDRRARHAANPAPIDAVRALFADNLERLRAARRFHQHLRQAQLRARTEAAFRAHRINLACHRIALDTLHARHQEATAALLVLTATMPKSTSTSTR